MMMYGDKYDDDDYDDDNDNLDVLLTMTFQFYLAFVMPCYFYLFYFTTQLF